MSLAQRCSGSFDSASRSRGQSYFQTNRVTELERYGRSASALVEGSHRDPYQVDIDWSDGRMGVIQVACTCPHYYDGFLCKHIWATLLAMDQAGLGKYVPGASRVTVISGRDRVGYDDDDDWEDDHWGENEALGAVGGAAGDSQIGRALVPRRNSGKAKGDWRRQLAPLRRAGAQGTDDAQPNDSLVERPSPPSQAWYVLDVGESLQRGKLIVSFHYCQMGKAGEFGKITRLSLQRGEVDSKITDPVDRELLQLLLGNVAEEEPTYSSSYFGYRPYGYRTYDRSAVAPAMFSLLLPRLCATGRFVWLLDDSLPVEDGPAIAWDGGPAWRFRVRVQPDDTKKRWRIVGQLYRDQETAELSTPVLLLAHGLVLFPEKLACLDAAKDFAWIAALRKTPTIEVPYRDRDEFLAQLWSASKPPDLELPDNLRVEQVRPEPQGKLCIRMPKRYVRQNLLYADVFFAYGEQDVSPDEPKLARFDPERNQVIFRTPDKEQELLGQLFELGLRESRGYYGDEPELEFAKRDLSVIVDQLTSRGWIVESEGHRIRRPGSIHLSVTTDIDWFELDGRVDFDGVSASLPSLLAALRNHEKYIRLDDGTHGMLPEEWLRRYGNLVELGEAVDGKLKFAPSQALILDALLAAQENAQVDRPFEEFREKLRAFSGIAPGRASDGFVGTLRRYQEDGLGWLHFLRDFRFGGCLADDMGLGKTVQVLALLESRRLQAADGHAGKPSLVVVPKSLVFNWIEEAARFTPQLRVLDYTGLERAGRLEEFGQYDLIVTTYGILRRDIVQLKDVPFDYAILDESQAIKNANSQAAKASRLLRADHRLAMTGTPVENHLGELWSLFEFLNPGMLGRSRAFELLAKQVRGDDDTAVATLARGLRPFLLRRTKEQVLTELPEKTEQTLICEMESKQRKLYDELREYYRASLAQRVSEIGLKRAKIHVLEALLRLRQAACHPGLIDPHRTNEPSAKLETLLEQIAEVVDEGHKALVFSQFTSLLAIVRQRLDKLGIVYEYLDGRTRQRDVKVKRFQEDAQCPLFLISLKAGGHGLNLTAADYVYILDPWWNPAVEAQAIDRTHRIGQSRRVFAYRLICHDTVEEKILELQREKRELADAIVSADNSLISSLTAEDLQMLLS